MLSSGPGLIIDTRPRMSIHSYAAYLHSGSDILVPPQSRTDKALSLNAYTSMPVGPLGWSIIIYPLCMCYVVLGVDTKVAGSCIMRGLGGLEAKPMAQPFTG